MHTSDWPPVAVAALIVYSVIVKVNKISLYKLCCFLTPTVLPSSHTSGDQSQWWSNGWSEFLPHLFPDWRGLSTTHPLLPVDEGGRVTHDQHSNPQLWHSLLVRRWSVQLSGHPHLQSAWGTTHCSCSLQYSLHEWVQSTLERVIMCKACWSNFTWSENVNRQCCCMNM